MRSHTREKPFYCYLPGTAPLPASPNGHHTNRPLT
jgi:hypothetical protein